MKEQRFDHNRPPILPVPGEDPSWGIQREKVYGDGLLALQEAEISKQRIAAQHRLETEISALRTGTHVQEANTHGRERTPLMIEGGSVTSEVMLANPTNSAAEAEAAMSSPETAAAVMQHKNALFGGRGRPSSAAAVGQS
jgi:hypothetical protein